MSEPVLSIERIRQPLTAILGRLDLVLDGDRRRLPDDIEVDLCAARAACKLLATWCDEAEKKHKALLACGCGNTGNVCACNAFPKEERVCLRT